MATNNGKKTERVRFGVRGKLLAVILPVVAVSMVVVVVIANISSNRSIQKEVKDLLDAQGKTSANAVVSWKNEVLGELEGFKRSYETLNLTTEEIKAYEESFLGSNDDYPDGIYIIKESGELIDASGWEPEDVLTEKSYYKEGLDHKDGIAFGEAYLDEFTGDYVVTATGWSENIDGSKGVMCTDVHLSILSSVVAELEVAGEGDAFIVDRDTATILAHADESLRGLTCSEVGDEFYPAIMASIEADMHDAAFYNSNNGRYLAAIENIQGTSWYIITRATEEKIHADVRRLSFILAGVGIFAVVGITLLLMFIINVILKPIQELTKTIVAITEGDFTMQLKVKTQDEMGLMAEEMKHFLEVMRGTIGTIVDISVCIDDQAKGSAEISGELQESASSQTVSMQQLQNNLEELVKSTAQIAEDATSLAIIVAETSESGDAVSKKFVDTRNEAESGRNSMTAVMKSMDEMSQDMRDLSDSIEHVGTAAVKINEITETIRSIADETNLLALNASIEAARAGEAGKGFAVVATEIKKLAETSASAADEISELIESVTEQITTTVDQSKTSIEKISGAVDDVDVAAEQFNTIFESIVETNGIVDDMIQKVSRVAEVSTNMAAITQEQSASADEIGQTAEDIMNLAGIVSENSASVKADADKLTTNADTLKGEVNKFTI